jgi:hypothetical protein
MNRTPYLRMVVVSALCSMLLGARAEQIEPRFDTDAAGMQSERAQTDRLRQAAKLHVVPTTPEWRAFMKQYRREADVVETSLLAFLDDSQQSPQAFMAATFKKDAWKKPMNTPLSFVFFLKLQTAHDWFRINYVRLHDCSLDLEVDQLCPAQAVGIKEAAMAVIEIPLGPMRPGSFHYSTWMNAGRYKKAPAALPQGWEYADVSRLSAGGSGCTIVDPATHDVPPKAAPPVRKAECLTLAQLDQALERLRFAKFPMSREKIYDLVGFSKEQRTKYVIFGAMEGIASVTHQLTSDGEVHFLEIRGKKGDLNFQGSVECAIIYYDDEERRRYTLYDSRIGLGK